MYTRAGRVDIQRANEKLHRIPGERGELIFKTESFRIEIDHMELTILDWRGTKIVIDLSGAVDERTFDDIELSVNEFGGVELRMPEPYHSVSFPLSIIEEIDWEYPHEEGWARIELFKKEKL